MQPTATLTLRPSAAISLAAVATWLQRAWHDLTMDDEERFLRGAVDLADLERRQQRLEHGRAEHFALRHRDA